jgi:hypothetical protein
MLNKDFKIRIKRLITHELDEKSYVYNRPPRLNLYRVRAYVPFEFVVVGESEKNAIAMAQVHGPRAARDDCDMVAEKIRVGSVSLIKEAAELPAQWDKLVSIPWGLEAGDARSAGKWFEKLAVDINDLFELVRDTLSGENDYIELDESALEEIRAQIDTELKRRKLEGT